MSTGVTTTGSASLSLSNLTSYSNAADSLWVDEIVSISALPTLTNAYQLTVGFGNSNGSSQTHGAYFVLDWSGSAARFRALSTQSSTTTTSASLTNPAANVPIRLRVVLTTSAARFYVDGQLVATNTTNLPSGFGQSFGVVNYLLKSAGTTATTVDTDAIAIGRNFTASRF